MVYKICEGIPCSSFSVKELDVIVHKNILAILYPTSLANLVAEVELGIVARPYSVLFMQIALTLLSVRILLARVSTANINKYGDRGQPCRTHLLMENHLDICPLFSTAAHISLYSVFTYDLNFKPKLKLSKHLSSYDHLKEPKAFSKSMESMIPFTLFCLV